LTKAFPYDIISMEREGNDMIKVAIGIITVCVVVAFILYVRKERTK
jgi:hypothetical protein